MGCGSSKSGPTDVREQSPWKREQNQVQGKVNTKRKNSGALPVCYLTQRGT